MLTYRYPPVAILSAVEDTTFLQDTYEEMNDTGVYGDELITNHRLKKIKPIYVNYARTAKRVDVRRLKDNLWKTLTTQPVSFYHFLSIMIHPSVRLM
jgi:condensin complex subunit 2